MNAVHAHRLPKIIRLLRDGDAPHFAVLNYAAFVKFVDSVTDIPLPDVAAVLDCGDEHEFVILSVAHYTKFLSALHLIGKIDEVHYQQLYPDVQAAISKGLLANAREHYLLQGYFEQREAKFPEVEG